MQMLQFMLKSKCSKKGQNLYSDYTIYLNQATSHGNRQVNYLMY